MTTEVKKKRDPSCPVCKKRFAKPGRRCQCPWDRDFEHWPPALLNTVKALVHGGPHED